jgi:hypothetical protein
MIAAILSLLGLGNSDNDTEPANGPEQIALARAELQDDSQPADALIGRPRLENYGGEFTDDLKAVIPLYTERYDDPAPLVFDVNGDDLTEFCAAYDLTVNEIGLLQGERVPIIWAQGQPTADWVRLLRPEEKDA